MFTLLKRYVILSHRYLGIALSLLVIVWFISGIVMMYAGGMPRLTPQLRLERLPDLDLSRVAVAPKDAADRVATNAGGGQRRGPARVQLLTIMDRPAYRVGPTIVFADTGDVLEAVTLAQAQEIAAKFMQVDAGRVHHVKTLTRIDQWTLGQSRSMPLHKFSVDDEAGTELYVQPASGEVVTLTTRQGRMLAWMGTIPHWLYFVALRENQPLWYQLVVWTSGAACFVAILGLILSVAQFKRVRPFSLRTAIPYSGWMRWHYITGAVFGIFTLTWAFSGLLSMEPFEWTNARGLDVRRDVFTGGPVDLSRFAMMEKATWQRVLDGRGIKEVDFVRIQDEHYFVVRQSPLDPAIEQRRERLHQPYYVTGRAENDRVLVNADTLEARSRPFTPESLVARLKSAVPDAPIAETALLTDYDSYYYSRGRQTPLPVLRVKFADPAETWVYVDPEMSQMLAQIPRLARVERWLYNGLHSLDFSFWYDKRPLWDIGMLTLLLGGLASTSFGLVMGVKRLRRGVRRTVGVLAAPAPASAQTQPAASVVETK
jgi:hypothetical protein